MSSSDRVQRRRRDLRLVTLNGHKEVVGSVIEAVHELRVCEQSGAASIHVSVDGGGGWEDLDLDIYRVNLEVSFI